MTTLTIPLPAKLKNQLMRAARKRRLTPSGFVRETIETRLRSENSILAGSLYELSRDLCGSVKNAPPELARNLSSSLKSVCDQRETRELVKEGVPVARLAPAGKGSYNTHDLADDLAETRLSAEDRRAMAGAVRDGRSRLKSPRNQRLKNSGRPLHPEVIQITGLVPPDFDVEAECRQHLLSKHR